MNFSFKDIDMYSKRIGLFYKNRGKLGSNFGFCLTMTYIFVSLGLFIFYTSQTIRRKDIKVHDSTMYRKDNVNINIDPHLFYFAFGVENPMTSTRFIDETIYYPKVTFLEKVKEGSSLKTVEEKVLDIERCKQEKFGEKYQKLLVQGELNDSYCINDINLTLAKGFTNDRISYIKIGIHACVNSTDNNNHCKPKEVIDAHISGTFFSLLAKDIGLDPSNYADPIIPKMQDLHTTIDKTFFRDFVLYFGLTEVQTDEGLFDERIHRETYMNFIKTTQAFYNRDEKFFYEGESMCEIQFQLGDDIRIQKRSFMKMTEVFAITGGYMQLISTIFKIISLLFNKISYEIKLVNSLFNIYPNEKKITLKHKLQKKINDILENKNNTVLYRTKKVNFSPLDNGKIYGIDKNKVNRLNVEDYFLKSINIDNNDHSADNNNNQNVKSTKGLPEENQNQCDDKRRESSLISDNKTKSKIQLLNFGSNLNSLNLNNQIKKISLKKSIKQSNISFEEKEDIKGININMSMFYYYCISKCKKNNSSEVIGLFNLAISFFKKKMDIIHLFYILILIERLLKHKSSNNKI